MMGRFVDDLLHFGGVLDRHAFGVQIVGKHIRPRPVTAQTPFHPVARFFHATGTAHQPIPAGHLECNVVERNITGAREGHRVMIGVAAHETHHAGAVAQAKAQHFRKERATAIHIV